MPNKWTREEQKQLIVELKDGTPLEEIAKKHNRTIMAVEVRIQKIVYDAVNKGTSFDRMAEIMGKNKKVLLAYYKDYVKFMETNKIIPKKEPVNEQTAGGDTDKVKKLEKLAFKLAVENKILKKVIKNMTTKRKH